MTGKPERDPNVNAARVVAQSTSPDDGLPADLTAAWDKWSGHIQKVDDRGMSLLKAAFEAGYDAGIVGGAASTGRVGGYKGGKARAEKLTPTQRKKIAEKAATARWAKEKRGHDGAE